MRTTEGLFEASNGSIVEAFFSNPRAKQEHSARMDREPMYLAKEGKKI